MGFYVLFVYLLSICCVFVFSVFTRFMVCGERDVWVGVVGGYARLGGFF